MIQLSCRRQVFFAIVIHFDLSGTIGWLARDDVMYCSTTLARTVVCYFVVSKIRDQVSDRHLDMEPVLGIDTSSRSQFARKPFDGIHRIPFPFLEVGSRHVGTTSMYWKQNPTEYSYR